MINEWMFLFLTFSVKVTYKHYEWSLSYKWHPYVILYELSTCYKEVFSTWLQLTTIILAVQRQWMLNFTLFCPSIHNAYTYFLCIFVCLFIIYNQVQETGLHREHDPVWAVLVQLLTSISSFRWCTAVHRLHYSFATIDLLTSHTYMWYNTLWRNTFNCRGNFVTQQLVAVDYKVQHFLQVYKSRKLLFYPTLYDLTEVFPGSFLIIQTHK